MNWMQAAGSSARDNQESKAPRQRGRDDGALCPNCGERYFGHAGHCDPCFDLIREKDWVAFDARTCEATRRMEEKCPDCGWEFRKDGHSRVCPSRK